MRQNSEMELTSNLRHRKPSEIHKTSGNWKTKWKAEWKTVGIYSIAKPRNGGKVPLKGLPDSSSPQENLCCSLLLAKLVKRILAASTSNGATRMRKSFSNRRSSVTRPPRPVDVDLWSPEGVQRPDTPGKPIESDSNVRCCKTL